MPPPWGRNWQLIYPKNVYTKPSITNAIISKQPVYLVSEIEKFQASSIGVPKIN
jgi:hypothetical protein